MELSLIHMFYSQGRVAGAFVFYKILSVPHMFQVNCLPRNKTPEQKPAAASVESTHLLSFLNVGFIPENEVTSFTVEAFCFYYTCCVYSLRDFCGNVCIFFYVQLFSLCGLEKSANTELVLLRIMVC